MFNLYLYSVSATSEGAMFMFCVLSVLCIQGRGKKKVVGIRFLDVVSSSIFDMDIDTLRGIGKGDSLFSGKEDYVDTLKPLGSELVTEYEFLNPNLGITDKSKDTFTIANLVVSGFTFNMAYRICYVKAKGDVRKLLKYYNETMSNAVRVSESEKTNKDKIVYEFEKAGVTFYEDHGFAKTSVAFTRGAEYTMLREDHFDRVKFTDIASFESAFNKKWKTSLNMADILGRADSEARKLLVAEQEKESLTDLALTRGKLLTTPFVSSLSFKGQKGVGGFVEISSEGYILNVPYKKVYVFDLENKSEREIYEELKRGVLDETWCHCGYTGTNVKYVRNYRGVSHGYTCPKCKRFKQIG
jgi:hypothetical protein